MSALALGAWMVFAAVAYVVTGGADFGGGAWDLLASGPRKASQRALVEQAIAPIWEANHVWLIALVVTLFAGFPRAFAVASTALHVPLALFLVGIVLRGASFVFRAYDAREDRVQERWGRLFSISSTVTPVLLGVVVGSLSTGGIEVRDGVVQSGFVRPWATDPFPWAVGVLLLALAAYLAAVYLTVEAAGSPELQEDFRKRALAAWGASAVVAVVTLALAAAHAPLLFEGLTGRPWSMALFASTAVLALLALGAIVRRRYRLARAAAAAEVAMLVVGWAAAQYPYLVADDVTLADASAPDHVQVALFWVFTVGALPLVLALRLLYRVFARSKGRGI